MGAGNSSSSSKSFPAQNSVHMAETDILTRQNEQGTSETNLLAQLWSHL